MLPISHQSMKKITAYIAMLMFSVLALTSCINQKQIAYFQKGNQPDTIAIAKAYTPTIQPGDILGIYVTSLNPVASSFFNPYASAQTNSQADNTANTAAGISPQPSTQATTTPGYLVDASGDIELPLLGDIKVAGLTTIQAKDLIKQKLKTYLKEPTVNIRFLNYKISVMGEVARPSVYVIPNERITLPEALSLAGDLTIYGKRSNIMVIRDVDGKKEFARIDLTKRDVYSSPYYYMHANDIIYVEPGKGRVAQTDRTYQIIPIVLSALSFIAIILNYTRK